MAIQLLNISVSGHVYDYNNDVFSGLKVQLDTSDTYYCLTDSNGYYLFENIPFSIDDFGRVSLPDSYKSGYFCEYGSGNFPMGAGDITDLNLFCFWSFNVSWRVLDSDGNVIPGAEVVFSDSAGIQARVVTESSTPDYKKYLSYRGKMTVTISKDGYSFSPDSIIFSLSRWEINKDLGTIIGTKTP